MSATEGQDRMLVCGDVDGNFEALLIRLEQVTRKLKFDQLFVCGEFFGPNEEDNKRLLSGEYVIPIPIYILGPTKPDRAQFYTAGAGNELSPNVIYLGPKGLFTTLSGMTVAYLSGREGEYQDDCHFSTDTVKELIVQITAGVEYVGVDLLLTSQWPLGIDKQTSYLPDVISDDKLNMSPQISKLAAALRPRYHFAALTNCHYERPPYRNHRVLQEQARHPTRFIGLARCGNPSRLKYVYAFNITPMKRMDRGRLVEEPNNITEFPYIEVLQELDMKESRKRASAMNVEQQQQQFFYSIPGLDDPSTGDHYRGGRGRKRQYQHQRGDFDGGSQQKRPSQQAPCWFCLSSSEVEKHLIVSIADHTYMALAKGQLVEDHVLIMPIGHIQSLTACEADVFEEIEKYKSALEQYFRDKSKTMVLFERNYKTQHLQLQIVPVDADKAHAVRNAFTRIAQLQNVDLTEVPDNVVITDLVKPGHAYFYAELPYGQKLYTGSMRDFPLQFGREVLACKELLNMEDRVDWKECKLTKEQEIDAALTFRKAFAKYDFNQME